MAKLPALPYVRSGVSQGLSANESYRQFQAKAQGEGLQGIRRQDYLRLHSQTVALREQAADAIDAPKDIVNGGLTPQPRDTITARGYGYWVAVHTRTSGETDFITQPWLVKSNVPLTPMEAERRAGAALANSEFEYDRVVLGVGFVGVEQFNPTRYEG